MAENTKVVIVGGGHNGLVAAGYLGRAGLDVQVLERRDVVGGAAVTEEWFPGFHISTCSYVCHILQQKVIDELELRKHGFHVYPLDPGRLHPFPDGRAIRLWHDDEKTAEEIRQFSPEDAEAWLDWADFWHRAVGILSDYYLQPPPSLAELTERFKDEEEEELLETLLTVPLRDLIDRTFVSEEMKAMASIGAIDMGNLSAPGSAYIMALYRFSAYRKDTENYGIVRGGMGSITQSNGPLRRVGRVCPSGLARSAAHPDGGRPGHRRGAANGEVIEADLVLSNADPKRTFTKLLDGADVDQEVVDEVEALKTQSASAKFLCSLRELPDFSRHLGDDYDPKHLSMINLAPSTDYCESSWNDATNGRLPETPVIQVQIPTVYDPSVAPEGQHVLSMWVFFVPAHLKDGSWSEMRQEFGEAADRRDVPLRAELQGRDHRLDAADARGHRRPHRPDGRQHPAPRHGSAADDVAKADARLVGLPHPHQEPLPLRRRHAPRRRGDGRAGAQRGACGAGGVGEVSKRRVTV